MYITLFLSQNENSIATVNYKHHIRYTAIFKKVYKTFKKHFQCMSYKFSRFFCIKGFEFLDLSLFKGRKKILLPEVVVELLITLHHKRRFLIEVVNETHGIVYKE